MTKRLLAINDISCVGKCSITATLPIVSAAGIECFVLPTAVLSTQTGGMKGYTYTDFTDEMVQILNHWRSLNLKFDAIYTGFLGSARQVSIVSSIIDEFGSDAFVIVDPVMGDFGNLYETFEKDFPEKMKSLCGKADLILPNYTEACLLLGKEQKTNLLSEDEIKNMLQEISKIGSRYSVITGISSTKEKIGASGYDSKEKVFFEYFSDNISGIFHGAGDVFASFVVSFVMNGYSIPDSIRNQVELTANCIQRTQEYGQDSRFGLQFEEEIPNLIEKIKRRKSRCSYRLRPTK